MVANELKAQSFESIPRIRRNGVRQVAHGGIVAIQKPQKKQVESRVYTFCHQKREREMHWIEKVTLRERRIPLRESVVAATVKHKMCGERLRVDDWSEWAHNRNEQLLFVLGI